MPSQYVDPKASPGTEFQSSDKVVCSGREPVISICKEFLSASDIQPGLIMNKLYSEFSFN